MSNTDLKLNKLLEEHENLSKSFYKESLEYEKKQKEFLKDKRVSNNQKNEIIEMGSSIKGWYKNQKHKLIQEMLYNKQISKELDLYPFFYTITLPSRFHPFKTTKNGKKLDFEKWRRNKSFGFNSIESSLVSGNIKLNEFWKSFYIKLKVGDRKYNNMMKTMKYNYTKEFHVSHQVHVHGLLFVNKDSLDYVNKCFYDTVKEFGFNKKSQDTKYDFHTTIKSGDFRDSATKYIFKYLMKNLDEDDENYEDVDSEHNNKYFYNFLFGWKRKIGNKVRLHNGSKSKIGINNFRKIYHNLDEETKEELIKKSKENFTCLLYEVEKITRIKREIITDRDREETKEKLIKEFGEFFTTLTTKEQNELIDKRTNGKIKIFNEHLNKPRFDVYLKKIRVERVVRNNLDVDREENYKQKLVKDKNGYEYYIDFSMNKDDVEEYEDIELYELLPTDIKEMYNMDEIVFSEEEIVYRNIEHIVRQYKKINNSLNGKNEFQIVKNYSPKNYLMIYNKKWFELEDEKDNEYKDFNREVIEISEDKEELLKREREEFILIQRRNSRRNSIRKLIVEEKKKIEIENYYKEYSVHSLIKEVEEQNINSLSIPF